MCWNTRIFSATTGNKVLSDELYLMHILYSNYEIKVGNVILTVYLFLGGGAFCNGKKIHASQTDLVSHHYI